jgi:hypothetical protein
LRQVRKPLPAARHHLLSFPYLRYHPFSGIARNGPLEIHKKRPQTHLKTHISWLTDTHILPGINMFHVEQSRNAPQNQTRSKVQQCGKRAKSRIIPANLRIAIRYNRAIPTLSS